MASYQIGDCTIYKGDNLVLLEQLGETAKNSISLVYIDPPFNTGKQMRYLAKEMVASPEGNIVGYGGKKYQAKTKTRHSYNDNFGESYVDFIRARIERIYPLLRSNGSLFLHVDYREVHYLKSMMDEIFGRANFINEIIWAYDYGTRSNKKWSPKHDNILWYVKDKDNYIFNYHAISKIPYMAPSLVGEEKVKQGKTPTDVWWCSIVGTNSKERASARGYPTQKPLKILERIVQVHSNEGDIVLDCFAGSGTAGVAAIKNNRKAILMDENPVAVAIIKGRIKATV